MTEYRIYDRNVITNGEFCDKNCFQKTYDDENKGFVCALFHRILIADEAFNVTRCSNCKRETKERDDFDAKMKEIRGEV